jgi:class 3 adenylate cyclase
MEIKINEKTLDEKLEELEKARSWSPRVISKLEHTIRSEDDYSLFRINPLKFGNEKNISEQEAIDLFLYGSKVGLFDMNWQLLCPKCGDVVESFSKLGTLDTHYHCNLCQEDFEAVLDDYIEISFTIGRQIRELVFHNPESLSVEDYYFKYSFSDGTVFPDGSNFVELLKSLTKIITYLEPNEKKHYELEITSGYLRGCDMLNRAEFLFNIIGEAENELQKFYLRLENGRFEPNSETFPPGKYVIELENLTNKRAAVFIIHHPHDVSPQMLQFEPFLFGKKLLTTQTFRNLFRSEIIEGTEGIGVKDITILFSDLKGSTALYDRTGDLNAFALVRQHFESLERVIREHSGAIVKTIGDAVMATFLNPIDAVNAALKMIEDVQQFNKRIRSSDIILKIGIHKGPSIAVTLNERLDYFGQTVNIASRVQRLADAEEIYVSNDVYTYPGVKELLKGLVINPGKAKLRGVQEETQVFKITKNRDSRDPGVE